MIHYTTLLFHNIYILFYNSVDLFKIDSIGPGFGFVPQYKGSIQVQ